MRALEIVLRKSTQQSRECIIQIALHKVLSVVLKSTARNFDVQRAARDKYSRCPSCGHFILEANDLKLLKNRKGVIATKSNP